MTYHLGKVDVECKMARFVAKTLRVCSGLPYTVLDPALK